VSVVFLYSVSLCPFETKSGSMLVLDQECFFKTGQVIFVPKWPKEEFFSL
jgi:hypothetical protein